ncbi:hypothetical protein O6H91_09G088800 [Diphasiastrum complanatum]|uniref:Uncharacterized protein n=1 Tax=Diphasiastrum complanatum TaxID=34168 RepID=A0ACC2CRU5_DIPCM|nr:hypothetical protein O6H91_09G088800 [Diphasiastrum complanatum]
MASPRFGMPMAGFAAASANYPPSPFPPAPSSQVILPASPGTGLLHPPPVLPPPQAAMAGMRFSAPPGIGRALPLSHLQVSYGSSLGVAGGASLQQPDLQAKLCVDKELDLAQLVLELKEFASQAEKTLQNVMNLTHLEDPVSGNASASVISAIGDTCQKDADSAVVAATEKPAFKSLGEFELTGGSFSYKDAPAVVQASSFRSNTHAFISLPPSIKAEIRTTTDTSEINESVFHSEKASSLMPSKLWLLHEELEAWQYLPSHYSRTVLEAAMGLDSVDQESLCEKLIVSSSSFRLPLDGYLACHISMLLKLCLLAIRKEAGERFRRWEEDSCAVSERFGNDNRVENKRVTDFSGKELSLHDRANLNIVNQREEVNNLMVSGGERREVSQTAHLPCPVLLECGDWLTSCLTLIYQPVQAKVIVLGMFKHSLICAGHVLTSSYFERSKQEEPVVGHQCVGMDIESHRQETITYVQNDLVDDDMYTDKKRRPELWQLEAAIDALHERSYMEELFKAKVSLAKLTKDQLLGDYDNIVLTATQERLKRPNLRAVLEHDGLNSNRQENQGTKRYKTKEELLAEERDYKRRRMSYRGKKIRRTPSQVIHDIIEAHMEEIVVAGGIGCFGKTGSEPQVPGNELSETRHSYREEPFVEKLSESDNDNTSPRRSRNHHSSSHKETPQSSLEDREGWKNTHARTESGNRDYRSYRLDKHRSPHGVNRDNETYHKNERENWHYDDLSDVNSRSSLSRGTSHDRHQPETNQRGKYEDHDKSFYRNSDESRQFRRQADDEYEPRNKRSSLDSKDFPDYKTDKSSEYKKRTRDHC